MSLTARDLLRMPLPGVNGAPVNSSSRKTNSSTYSTVEIQEPLCFVKDTPESWWQIPSKLDFPLLDSRGYYEPYRERNTELQTEGDVDIEPHLYIFYIRLIGSWRQRFYDPLHGFPMPIIVGVNIRFLACPVGQIFATRFLRKTTAPAPSALSITSEGNLVCLAGLQEGSCFRPLRGTLLAADWVDALITNLRTKEQICKDATLARNGTLLLGSAPILAKQAVKYHSSSGCPVVIFFDWDSMILFNFQPAGNPWSDTSNPVEVAFSDGTKVSHRQLLFSAMIWGLRLAEVHKFF